MPEAEKLRAADAFWRDPEGAPQQVEAMALLAQRLKARPRFIQGLPIEKRAQYLAHYRDARCARRAAAGELPPGAPAPDDGGVSRRAGHSARRRPHHRARSRAAPSAADKVAAGAKALEASYPAEDVQRYFATLLAQDPDTWAGLEAHLKS